ncbi:putative protein [Arabidopsis thaliana]|uniref:Amine oxidase n=1 Tax=Arabidopsis thaliana TaxID=3702 RepID=Q9LZG6_ARATH|nr:putative protein [Arabidopsis thaliana]
MDIDGPAKNSVKIHLEKQRLPPGKSRRKSYLKVKKYVACRTDKDAQIKLSLNLAGYKLLPSGNAASLLDNDDPPHIRGAFTNNQELGLSSVTRYNRSEKWAGGLLMYQNRGEDTPQNKLIHMKSLDNNKDRSKPSFD